MVPFLQISVHAIVFFLFISVKSFSKRKRAFRQRMHKFACVLSFMSRSKVDITVCRISIRDISCFWFNFQMLIRKVTWKFLLNFSILHLNLALIRMSPNSKFFIIWSRSYFGIQKCVCLIHMVRVRNVNFLIQLRSTPEN